MLAGIGVEYYIQLEHGTVLGISDDVVDAIARALHLYDPERNHLVDLVHAARRLSAATGR